MTEITWDMLRALLVTKYDDFRKRLARRLGSDDLARELLHETYLSLGRTDKPASVQQPEPYLFRIALNIAADRHRAESRKATAQEIEAALELVDETVRIEEVVEARRDLAALEDAIQALPPRRRTIFLAARVHEQPIQGIADSLGISRRLVELELKRALVYCAERLDRPLIQRFGPMASKTSYTIRGGGKVEETRHDAGKKTVR
ncbi:RNA polymerase sigma factor [Magnetospirillum fulvum]|uniref:RNA polymerase sigma-70 factor, ECF subfamily n=1 Tax=Magnetospirillum fulvum TaxID=1082 RepID=A0A1H6IZT6_MAGFU|nr:RNA polymerase sigma factor [Magnetospirillum fulvum]SEH55120.1 RNA polymerase sigma-70 factor, ECF subfamily [Magnetospirillum fulvum]